MTLVDALAVDEAADDWISGELRRACWNDDMHIENWGERFVVFHNGAEAGEFALCPADITADDWEVTLRGPGGEPDNGTDSHGVGDS